MAAINKIFNGRLNLDDSAFFVEKGDFIAAFNITSDQIIGQHDLVRSNIRSNRFVAFNLPLGSKKVIGAFPDTLRNAVYYFIYNSDGFHTIAYYNNETRTITKIFQNKTDSNGVDILPLDVNSKINHINVLHRDEGDLLMWTDGNIFPCKINIQRFLAGSYTYIKQSFIELAKRPPLTPPACIYGSDSSRNANSLRKKLFQFTYRFKYDDFEKTTFSSYSKIPLPAGFYTSDNDIDNQKNNFITITVETGDENVTDIEIAMRNNINDAWGDFVLIITLNKAQLGIPDNVTYDYVFYNDSLYPPLDSAEVLPLFDWVPQKAKSQCMPNGNVIVFGAITENYNNYPVDQLDITLTAANVDNDPPDPDPAQLQVFDSGSTPDGTLWHVIVTGTVNTGSVYTIVFNTTVFGIITIQYAAQIGDTINDVANGLYTASIPYGGTNYSANEFDISIDFGSSLLSATVTGGAGGGGTVSTEKTWLWDANYIFGLVYVDEQNRDMPGVTTFASGTTSDTDFVVTTPSFSQSGGNPQTPVISATINHLPPTGAVKYYWVRRRQTYGTFLFYETCDYQSDTDFLYFCLANIDQYKTDNSQFIYGTAPITSESRIKIVAGITTSAFNGDVWTQDYEILGTVTRTLSGGSSPANDVAFIKVAKPAAAISPAYTANMLVMVYTPAANPTSAADSVYYEWGEAYDIYELHSANYSTLVGAFIIGEIIVGGTSGARGTVRYDSASSLMEVEAISGTFVVGETITGVTSLATATLTYYNTTAIKYHKGEDQDQTAGQPASFTFTEGDVYYHPRTMYNELTATPYTGDTVSVMDANFSDFFQSGVNDNGRAQAIEINAKQQYFPTLVRFSQAYQNNTNINGLNRFYFEDFDEYNRDYGDILKLDTYASYMKVGQRYRIGNVPVFLQIIKDQSGNDNLAISDRLLNQIVYYQGDYGVGNSPESWARNNFAVYFCDTNRGVVCRLSQDGITPISILYKINSWATEKLPLRNGNSKVYGVFNAQVNRYEFAMEATTTDPAFTMAFDELNNAFEGERGYQPDFWCCLGTLLVSFKEGQLWTHDHPSSYNNFYGIPYESYITAVFNEGAMERKVFTNVSEATNKIWDCPEISTNIESTPGVKQSSNLIIDDFSIIEDEPNAAFLGDENSPGGLINGDSLRGYYLIVKFRIDASRASDLSFLSTIKVRAIDSPLNIR